MWYIFSIIISETHIAFWPLDGAYDHSNQSIKEMMAKIQAAKCV